jgi:hypothetical protein
MNSLMDWIKGQPDSNFPVCQNGDSYPQRLVIIHDKIKPILEMIGTCSAAQDGNALTDHSIRHVDMVIERASKLLTFLTNEEPQTSDFIKHQYSISPYEIYLLLVAIHFHDAGNIFGRNNHAGNAKKVIQCFSDSLNNNHLEIKAICDIIKAHASDYKISDLKEKDTFNSITVHYQFLAAILRFADELADDSSRIEQNTLHMDTPLSENIYHKYSQSLHSVIIEPENNTIQLKFAYIKDDAIRTFSRSKNQQEEQVYLQDEIIKRITKMFNEMLYCMKFTAGKIFFDKINVTIEIYDSEYDSVIYPMNCILSDKGYPNLENVLIDIKKGKELHESLQ